MDAAMARIWMHGHKEVARHDGPRMILQERGPPLITSGSTRRPSRQILSHRARRDAKAEFQQQFVRDPLLTPQRILSRRPSNQCS